MLFRSPEASTDWISTLGVFGCLALFVAALLLIPVCIGQCLSRKVSLKRIVISFYHVIAKKALKLAGYKTIGFILGITLLALFIPFIADFLAFIVYIFGALVAAKLGLLDNLGDETVDWLPLGFLDYSTDKWEDYGSTAYRLYHDD